MHIRFLVSTLIVIAAACFVNAQGPVDSFIVSGTAHLKAGKNNDAIEDFTKAIALDSKNAQAYFLRGVARQEAGDFPGGILDFSKVIELRPDRQSGYLNRGKLRLETKEYQAALSDLNKAIEIGPASAEAYLSRGKAKSLLNDVDGGIADYTKTLELAPRDIDAYYLRGINKAEKKDYTGAIADATSAIAIKALPVLYRFRSELHRENGNLALAIADAKSAAGKPAAAAAETRKYDEFGPIPDKDAEARLFELAVELVTGSQESRVYLIGYGGILSKRNASSEDLAKKKAFLEKCGIPAARIVTMDGGFKEIPTTELFIVPPNGETPTASPTVDPSQVKTRPAAKRN